MKIIVCIAIVTFLSGCEQAPHPKVKETPVTAGMTHQDAEPTPAWRHPEFKQYYLASNPAYWKTNLGKSVSVKGIAVQGKMGAQLKSEYGDVWINDWNVWPSDIRWQIVRVTGTVIKRHDGPQLSKEQLELPPEQQGQGTVPAGRALPEGSKELYEARRRYLLKDVKYTVVKEKAETPNKWL